MDHKRFMAIKGIYGLKGEASDLGATWCNSFRIPEGGKSWHWEASKRLLFKKISEGEYIVCSPDGYVVCSKEGALEYGYQGYSFRYDLYEDLPKRYPGEIGIKGQVHKVDVLTSAYRYAQAKGLLPELFQAMENFPGVLPEDFEEAERITGKPYLYGISLQGDTLVNGCFVPLAPESYRGKISGYLRVVGKGTLYKEKPQGEAAPVGATLYKLFTGLIPEKVWIVIE